ncbi:MAG: LPS-assembly protein LptD [bacterium]|nr:LPS-assembly protein LptD [bacterium]
MALTLLLMMCSYGFAQEEQIILRAKEQEMEGDVWRGSIDVEVLYQEIRLHCDEIEVNQITKDLTARGNVVLDQGPHRFTADELRYNLDSKTGMFFNATGDMGPHYHFTGAEVEKLDETHYRLFDATFTSCEVGDRPPWQFSFRKALLEEEGYGRFKGTTLRVKGVPIFYLPYMTWPIKSERTAGLLMPSFGYSNVGGSYLGNALYIPLGRSYDTTVMVDYYSNGFYGLGSEWRWAPKEEAFGEVNLYTILDKETGEWQWKVDGLHQQSDFLGFRMLAQVEALSDVDFFQRFERSFVENTRRDTFSYLYLTRSWGPAALNLRADTRTTFLTTNDVRLTQVPEVELRVRPTRLGRSTFYWSLISSMNLFDVDRGNELVSTYGRADLFPELSVTLPGPPWLSITPRVGMRGTYYSQRLSEDRQHYEDESLIRSYGTAGVDIVGPSISRIFNFSLGGFSKFKHLVEPRIEYGYVSDIEDQDLVPKFDEVDSPLVANKARFTLANRLFGKKKDGSGARELGSLELYQDYSFSEPLNTASDGRESQRGPLGASLRVTPRSGMTFDLRASYDTMYKSLRSSSLSASVGGRGGFGTITWYESYSPQNGEKVSSQARTGFSVGGRGKPLRLDAHIGYDFQKKEFLQYRALVRYEGSCWGVTMEYRDLRFGTYPTRDYRVMVDFKGIGRLLEIKGGLGAD